MKSQEIGIKPTLHVVLAADNQMLDEVMVVAYGTAKKSSFTGAASSVNAEKVLKDVPVTSFEQALQGGELNVEAAVAQYWLGQMYKEGIGVSKDCEKGEKLIHLAAINGYAPRGK